MTTNRRQFTRIQFQTNASLHLPNGKFDVEVADISFKGALVHPKTSFPSGIGTPVRLEILLDDAGSAVRMEATVVHSEANCIGLACREIDIDSITHLRRLVELNVGEESILTRELSALAKLDA